MAENDNPEHIGIIIVPIIWSSSSLITNLDGEAIQHIEYVPFGEVFIEERNDVWNTPDLFNAKELDEETGLYYYGARYYDPRTSVWLSADPLQEKYPNVSTYTYTKMNAGQGIGAKWNRYRHGFNTNGSIRLPQAGEGAKKIKFLPPLEYISTDK